MKITKFFLGSVQSPGRLMWVVFFWTRRTTSHCFSPSQESSPGSSTCLPSRSSSALGQSPDAPSEASASSLRRFAPPNFRPENRLTSTSQSSYDHKHCKHVHHLIINLCKPCHGWNQLLCDFSSSCQRLRRPHPDNQIFVYQNPPSWQSNLCFSKSPILTIKS